jgi:hypothetical protein
MKKYLYVSIVALSSALISSAARADTLVLEGTSGVLNQSGTAYIYPYSFSINGSSSTVDLMCMDDQREVTVGESWQANPDAITSGSSRKDQIAAYIFSQIGKNGVTDDDAQEAIWSLFDPADKKTAEDKKLIHEGSNVLRDGDTSGFDDGEYTNWTAVDGSQSEGGIPQDFIGPSDPRSVSPVPEPSTLMMFGSGFAALVGVVRRRVRA